MRIALRVLSIVFIIACVVLLAGFGAKADNAQVQPVGFLIGIWHGVLTPFAILLHLIWWSRVHVWQTPNTGFGYFFGVAIGFLTLQLSIGIINTAILAREKEG